MKWITSHVNMKLIHENLKKRDDDHVWQWTIQAATPLKSCPKMLHWLKGIFHPMTFPFYARKLTRASPRNLFSQLNLLFPIKSAWFIKCSLYRLARTSTCLERKLVTSASRIFSAKSYSFHKSCQLNSKQRSFMRRERRAIYGQWKPRTHKSFCE